MLCTARLYLRFFCFRFWLTDASTYVVVISFPHRHCLFWDSHFTSVGIHPPRCFQPFVNPRWPSMRTTVLSVLRHLYSCIHVTFFGILLFAFNPFLLAAHLMTHFHSLNLSVEMREMLVVIGSVLFEYSLAGYLRARLKEEEWIDKSQDLRKGNSWFVLCEDYWISTSREFSMFSRIPFH